MPVIHYKVYNTMREPETCPECARLDGSEYLEEDDTVQIPHPGCTAPRGCECYWTWMKRAEGDDARVVRPTKRLC